ncbi:MAG TPA: flagellin [Syntrophales bacterium]|nr:flagellin [Syntrophales bacterium]
MAFRIQNNITALNAQRNLNISDSAMSKSLERLSSGYRINRAADDAAGLAVSQQFRADIASYKVASQNAAEANSLLQVAEGAMDQMGNILTRLKELATQAASGNAGTNITKINAEANQLVEEFDRIATSTTYAGTALLTGNLAAGTKTGTAAETGTMASTSGDLMAVTSTAAGLALPSSGSIDDAIASLADGVNNTWTIAADGTGSGLVLTNGLGMTYTGDATATGFTIHGMGADQGDLEITSTDIGSANLDTKTITFNNLGLNANDIEISSSAENQVYTFSTSGGNIVLTGADGSNQSLAEPTEAATLNFDELGISIDLGTKWASGDLDGLTITVAGSAGSSMDFQIGAQNAADNRLSISLSDSRGSAMGLATDMLNSQTNAQSALDTIDTAISNLAGQRGNIGAYMNRLSYASSNLATIVENVASAESVIRDVDMAAEMTTFTKNQILVQAGTAMLAQANMASQSVLSLISG